MKQKEDVLLKSRRFWLGTLVSLGFLALFFYQTDLGQIGGALVGANYLWLAPAVVVYFVGVWFRALRWHHLLRPMRSVAAGRLFYVVVIGYLANDVLPLRAGELVRAYLLGEKEGMSRMAVLATIAVERTFDGLVLLLFAIGMGLFLPLAGWIQDAVRVVTVLFGAAFALFLGMVASEDLTRRALSFGVGMMPKGLGSRLQGMAERFVVGLQVLRSPGGMGAVFATSALAWLMESATAYLTAASFDLGQPFPVILLATAAANLSITLPSSQGGIGPFEYFASRTVAAFGTELSLAMAYAVVFHAVVLLPVIALGFVFLARENLSLASMVRQETAR